MKVMVAVEIGNRTVTEQHLVPGNTRKDWRAAISDIACRIELGTYGPPGPVDDMTAEDPPVAFHAAPPPQRGDD
jgi:hypothetical protein